MAFQYLFKCQDYESMLTLRLQFPKAKEPTMALQSQDNKTNPIQVIRNSRPHPTSRGRRRVATHGLGVARKPPPGTPPQRQWRLHLNTKTTRSNTTVWQVINLDSYMYKSFAV